MNLSSKSRAFSGSLFGKVVDTFRLGGLNLKILALETVLGKNMQCIPWILSPWGKFSKLKCLWAIKKDGIHLPGRRIRISFFCASPLAYQAAHLKNISRHFLPWMLAHSVDVRVAIPILEWWFLFLEVVKVIREGNEGHGKREGISGKCKVELVTICLVTGQIFSDLTWNKFNQNVS